jgi:hypothetical protein
MPTTEPARDALDDTTPAELERLTRDVSEKNEAKNALPYGSPERHRADHDLLIALEALHRKATPERITALVARAREADGLREALEMIADLTADDDDGDPEWTIGQVRLLVARSVASPTAPDPSGAPSGLEKDHA